LPPSRTAKKGEWGIRKDRNGYYEVYKPHESKELHPILFTSQKLTGHYLRISKPDKNSESVKIFPHIMINGLVKTIYTSEGLLTTNNVD